MYFVALTRVRTCFEVNEGQTALTNSRNTRYGSRLSSLSEKGLFSLRHWLGSRRDTHYYSPQDKLNVWRNQRMDAAAIVKRAKTWQNVKPQRICHGPSSSTQQEIPTGGTLSITIDTIACSGTEKMIGKLEHVSLTVSFQHRKRGDVSIDLFSPSGTRNEMLSTRRYDESKNGLHDWTFMTVHNWGENPKGEWIMNVTDNLPSLNKGVDPNGYVQHDTSMQEADVEDLEEEVIDDEKKTQELEAKKKGQKENGKKPSDLDVPYPEGVKKNRVATRPNMGYESAMYSDFQPEMMDPMEMAEIRQGISDDRAYFNYGPGQYGPNTYGTIDATNQNRIPVVSKDTITDNGGSNDESNQIYGYDRFAYDDSPKASGTVPKIGRQRVQVTTEETGSQRVQVNNGFQEEFVPGLNENSGDVSSGVVLEWMLTFYGSGPDDASESASDDDDSDANSSGTEAILEL